MAKVIIIILNWNGLNDTIECLTSVFLLEYDNFEVIVVDNGSSDDSVEIIRNRFPRVFLIQNQKNLGYTGGNNVGIHHAMQSGADYVWLLNNDTVVEVDSLSKLVDEGEKSPKIGLVSPAIYYYDQPDEAQFIGSYVDFSRFDLIHVEDPNMLDNEIVKENLTLWGTALLVKGSLIKTIGGLSEKYFAYAEDCDYSFKAKKNNFSAKVRLDARIYHKESKSTGKKSPIQTFLRARNTLFLWQDHTGWPRKILVPAFCLASIINSAKILADEGNENSYDACLNGFWAGLKGRGGAYDPTLVAPAWLRSVIKIFINWHPYFWVNFFKFNFKGIASDFSKRFGRIS